MEPSPSTSTGTPLRLLWRLFNNRNLRRVVGVRRGPAPFRNHATCSLRIFFAHQDEHPAQTGERVLHQGRRSEVAVDARRIEQSLDHQRLRLPLRVEHLHQFLVWIRTGIRTRLRVGGRIARFCHDISNSGIGPCGRTPCDTAILLPFPGRVGAWESVSRVDAASSRRVAILPRGASFPARARAILGGLPIFSSERHFCAVAFFRSSGRMTITIGATPGRVASSKIVGREKGHHEHAPAGRAGIELSHGGAGNSPRTRRGSPQNSPPATDDQHGDVRHQPGLQPHRRRSLRTGRRSQARRARHVPRQRTRLRPALQTPSATPDEGKVPAAVASGLIPTEAMPYTSAEADHRLGRSGDLVENTFNISSPAKAYFVALDHDMALHTLTVEIALRSDFTAFIAKQALEGKEGYAHSSPVDLARTNPGPITTELRK